MKRSTLYALISIGAAVIAVAPWFIRGLYWDLRSLGLFGSPFVAIGLLAGIASVIQAWRQVAGWLGIAGNISWIATFLVFWQAVA